MTYLGPYRRRRWIKAKLVTNPKKVVVEYLSNVPLDETKKFYKTDEWKALRKEYMEKNKAKNFKCNYKYKLININHFRNNLQIKIIDCQ